MRTKFLCLFLAMSCFAVVQSEASAAADAVRYRMPVDGVVVDPFRPPTNPYGPGNRGWELEVGIWTEVLAPADGTVTFAGQVGGTLSVVIQHQDGVRTTMSKLDEIEPGVAKGVSVQLGQKLGIVSGGFYFGARCGSAYIDPALLFDLEVFLVPLNGKVQAQRSVPSVCSGGTASEANLAWLRSDANTPRKTEGALMRAVVEIAVELVASAMRSR